VKYAYVEEEYRGCGIGTQLMQHALTYGRKNQCPFAFVETMSFQALDFYQKIGFRLDLHALGISTKPLFIICVKNYKTHHTQNEQNEVRDFEKSINSKSAAIFY
jgi:N-acetylglutamate synthase-like GNAT family acetyltransferase